MIWVKVIPGGMVPCPTTNAATGRLYLIPKNHRKTVSKPGLSASRPEAGRDNTTLP